MVSLLIIHVPVQCTLASRYILSLSLFSPPSQTHLSLSLVSTSHAHSSESSCHLTSLSLSLSHTHTHSHSLTLTLKSHLMMSSTVWYVRGHSTPPTIPHLNPPNSTMPWPPPLPRLNRQEIQRSRENRLRVPASLNWITCWPCSTIHSRPSKKVNWP